MYLHNKSKWEDYIMYCENCGKKLIRGYQFCIECGTPVPPEQEEEETSAEQQPAETPQSAGMPEIAPPSSEDGTLVFCPTCGMRMQKSVDFCEKCGMKLSGGNGGSSVPLVNTDPLGGGLGGFSDSDIAQIDQFVNNSGFDGSGVSYDGIDDGADALGGGNLNSEIEALNRQFANLNSSASEMPAISAPAREPEPVKPEPAEPVKPEPAPQPEEPSLGEFARRVDNFSMEAGMPETQFLSESGLPVIDGGEMAEPDVPVQLEKSYDDINIDVIKPAPSYIEPVAETSAYAEPVAEEPAYTEPVVEEPAYVEPVAETPAYVEPVAEAPAYAEPVAEEPAYVEPVVEEPAYAEPVAEEPAYVEPVAETPAYAEPVAEEPAYAEPVVEEPAYAEPVAETPAYAEPVVETPAYVEPVAEEPAYAEPVAEEPAYAEPVAETPAYAEPVVETPAYVEPVAEAPAYAEPVAEEPAYAEPVAETPAYAESVAEEPAYVEPVAETPAYVEPVAETPAYAEPVVEEPAYAEPVAEEPAYVEPVAETPAYVEPVAETPAYTEPVAEEPAYAEPVAETPAYAEPVAEAPAYVEPVAEEPAYAEPVAEEPTVSLQKDNAPDFSEAPAAIPVYPAPENIPLNRPAAEPAPASSAEAEESAGVDLGKLVYCRNCGQDMYEKEEFCKNCGSPNKWNVKPLKHNVSGGKVQQKKEPVKLFGIFSIPTVIGAAVVVVGIIALVVFTNTARNSGEIVDSGSDTSISFADNSSGSDNSGASVPDDQPVNPIVTSEQSEPEDPNQTDKPDAPSSESSAPESSKPDSSTPESSAPEESKPSESTKATPKATTKTTPKATTKTTPKATTNPTTKATTKSTPKPATTPAPVSAKPSATVSSEDKQRDKMLDAFEAISSEVGKVHLYAQATVYALDEGKTRTFYTSGMTKTLSSGKSSASSLYKKAEPSSSELDSAYTSLGKLYDLYSDYYTYVTTSTDGSEKFASNEAAKWDSFNSAVKNSFGYKNLQTSHQTDADKSRTYADIMTAASSAASNSVSQFTTVQNAVTDLKSGKYSDEVMTTIYGSKTSNILKAAGYYQTTLNYYGILSSGVPSEYSTAKSNLSGLTSDLDELLGVFTAAGYNDLSGFKSECSAAIKAANSSVSAVNKAL